MATRETQVGAAGTPDTCCPSKDESLRRRIRLVAVVGAVIAVAWVLRFFPGAGSWAPGGLALVAAVLGGYPIASKAVKAALRRQLSVDALVTVAASAAIALGNHLEAGIVVFILLLGELLEDVTVAKTSKAIQGLASLIPDTVRLKRGDDEIEVAVSQVAIGDVVVVRSGERIAVDGVITRGKASIDQSPITGESLPVDKSEGDEVSAGTVNQLGAIEVTAVKVGRDTTAAQIEAMVIEAQKKKAPVQRLVDRFATYFVPAMFLLAALVYLVTSDPRRAITVLVVACPCALVLGTPTAMVAAIGAAARKGVLIRGGDVLETLGRLNGVIFDKTGTITRGSPTVVDVRQICGHSERDILQFAAVAEKLSEHPLASAILERAQEHEITISAPDDFRVKRGQGIEVQHEGLRIVLGNRSLLLENHVVICSEAEDYMREREARGETTLLVAHDREICGVVTLADPIREEAAQTIGGLRRMGVSDVLAMYTGDNPRTASAIAVTLGIEEVAAGLLPRDKVDKVRSLVGDGHTIAMVGDGINDAPALAAADVGIAMGGIGSDITLEAAGVVLLTDDLSNVPAVIGLGKRALSVVRQNLFFALLFNTAMILLASMGIVSMVLGAVFHQGSSLFVILNSMRLLAWQGAGPRRGGGS